MKKSTLKVKETKKEEKKEMKLSPAKYKANEKKEGKASTSPKIKPKKYV